MAAQELESPRALRLSKPVCAASTITVPVQIGGDARSRTEVHGFASRGRSFIHLLNQLVTKIQWEPTLLTHSVHPKSISTTAAVYR